MPGNGNHGQKAEGLLTAVQAYKTRSIGVMFCKLLYAKRYGGKLN
jgi:hypothetical protein